jgi:hypothetical protein
MRFQILTATSKKMTAFWDIAPCSLVDVDRRFRAIHRPDNGGITHLWKFGLLQRNYTALNSRRLSSIYISVTFWRLLAVETAWTIEIKLCMLFRYYSTLSSYSSVFAGSCEQGNLWNAGLLLQDYTAQYARRLLSFFILAAVRSWNSLKWMNILVR